MKCTRRRCRLGRSGSAPSHPWKCPRLATNRTRAETDNDMTLSLRIPPDKLTMQSAVEAKLREIESTATGLLQEVGNADPFVAEALRDEASRLHGIAFTVARLLCYDDVDRAYRLINGDLDGFGDVLGTVA